MARNWPPLLWTGLWAVVMATAFLTRPLMPMDETRYVAVAWDMWLSGNFLVPHLNGETYSQKPPLLFWLINLGWGAFGVNEWWPRLVAPLFGLASLFLTQRLARELWPETSSTPGSSMAPLVLIGGFFWAVFTTLTMFDMILTAFVLIGLIGVVKAWRGGGWGGLLLLGLGIGFGILTKGPAVLVHTLPAALLAPWWGRGMSKAWTGRKGLWYVGILVSVVLGAAIALAWAVPAGMAGGEAYRDAIFWGQSAGRMVSSFAHSQPWWWYGAVLPVLLLPWVTWPAAWRAARLLPKRLTLEGGGAEAGGMRFCVAWFVPAVIVFSFISGKQFHYLLPELPAFALVLARLLAAEDRVEDGAEPKASPSLVLPGLLAVILAAALFALPVLPLPALPQPWWDLVASGWGVLLAAAGVGVMAAARLPLSQRIAALAALAAGFVVSTHLAMRPVLAAVFDLKPVALRLAEWQRQGVPLANFSKYHGQYNFLGRLKKPIAQVGMFSPDTAEFIKRHPDGLIIAYHDKPIILAKPIVTYRFRSRLIAIWEAGTVARYPGVTER